ncbi:glycosyltransferase [Sediminibacillus massiliensis]|uniref:glycosyltransferase n=1 Tax=Sediminibacillus massiliensis TaxID=1926277 RepID=UPI0009887CF7|nr:glycosyltransferase [Sediminibacillus massiliensis]
MRTVMHLNLRVDPTQYIPQIREVPGYDYLHLVRQPKYMVDMSLLNEKVHYLNEIFTPEEFVKKNNINVLHAHHAQLGMLLLPFKNKTNLPLVTSIRGRDATLANQPVGYMEGVKKLFEEGELFLPVCNYLADRIMDWGCPPEKVKVLYGGVNLEQFKFRPPNIAGDSQNILSMGRLVEKKGHHVLMRAFKKIQGNFPSATLTIIGGGLMEEELRNLAAELQLGDSFQLFSKIPKSLVHEKMNQADLFVAASMEASNGDVEGIPNTVKEAMATGLPVVTTTHAGIPELVTNNVEGLLVKENNVDELAEAIEYMLLNRAVWKRYTFYARKKVEQYFDQQQQLQTQAGIYDELLGGLE